MSQQNLARDLRAQAYRLRKELNPTFTSVTDKKNLSDDEYATQLAEENRDMDAFMGQHIAKLLEMTTPTKVLDEDHSSIEEEGEPSDTSPMQARQAFQLSIRLGRFTIGHYKIKHKKADTRIAETKSSSSQSTQ
jgi:hypothetical protein